MFKPKSSLFACGLLSLLGVVGDASAADYLVTLGNSSGQLQSVVVNTGDRFLVDFGASRSYTCEGIPVNADTNFDISLTAERLDGTGNPVENVTVREVGTVPPPITGDLGDSGNNRVSLIATTAGRFRFTVANAAAGGEPVKLRCFATTLNAPFNTTVNDFNFLEMTNIGNATCNAQVSIVDQAGTTLVTNSPVSVPAQRRVDFDVHTSTGADKFGFVRVTHDCPLGTLGGSVSQYSGTVSNFSLSVSLPLTPFDQRS